MDNIMHMKAMVTLSAIYLSVEEIGQALCATKPDEITEQQVKDLVKVLTLISSGCTQLVKDIEGEQPDTENDRILREMGGWNIESLGEIQ